MAPQIVLKMLNEAGYENRQNLKLTYPQYHNEILKKKKK